MSFRYNQINTEIIDSLKRICERPTTEWTDSEVRQVTMILEAIKIAMSQRK
jgi:hypothetical protein